MSPRKAKSAKDRKITRMNFIPQYVNQGYRFMVIKENWKIERDVHNMYMHCYETEKTTTADAANHNPPQAKPVQRVVHHCKCQFLDSTGSVFHSHDGYGKGRKNYKRSLAYEIARAWIGIGGSFVDHNDKCKPIVEVDITGDADRKIVVHCISRMVATIVRSQKGEKCRNAETKKTAVAASRSRGSPDSTLVQQSVTTEHSDIEDGNDALKLDDVGTDAEYGKLMANALVVNPTLEISFENTEPLEEEEEPRGRQAADSSHDITHAVHDEIEEWGRTSCADAQKCDGPSHDTAEVLPVANLA